MCRIFRYKNLKKSAAHLGIALMIWFFAGSNPSFALEGYYTDDFLVDIKVTENCKFEVTETINVDFFEERHGIYRDIPYTHGRVIIKDVQVEGDSFKKENLNEGDSYLLRVIIGDANKTITGKKTYKIKYTLVGSADKYEDMDFLYLDLLPTMWESPIKNAKITLTMPKALQWEDAEYFSGAYGSKELSEKFKITAEDKVLKVKAKNVEQGEGLTVIADLEEGYWQGIEDRTWAYAALTGILIVIPIIMILLWFMFGRDKKIIPQVEFYPPDELSPLDIGVILDGNAQKKDFLSLIPYLANKGYIRITPIDKKDSIMSLETSIERVNESRAIVHFMEALFPNGRMELDTREFDKKQAVYHKYEREESYKAAVDSIEFKYQKSTGAIYTKASRISAIVGGILVFLIPLAVIHFTGLYLGAALNAEWNLHGVAMILGTLGFLRIVKEKYDMPMIFKILLGVLSLGLMGLGIKGMYDLMDFYFTLAYLPVIIISFGISAFFEMHMTSRTSYNVELMGRILGFKEFIRVAELDKIKMMVEEDPNYFFKILPYAYVFDLTNKWMKQFKDIDLEAPSWYNSTYDNNFHNGFAVASVLSSIDSFGATVSAFEPESESGSSGGSSGGGFGGGGGGSW